MVKPVAVSFLKLFRSRLAFAPLSYGSLTIQNQTGVGLATQHRAGRRLLSG